METWCAPLSEVFAGLAGVFFHVETWSEARFDGCPDPGGALQERALNGAFSVRRWRNGPVGNQLGPSQLRIYQLSLAEWDDPLLPCLRSMAVAV